MTYITLDTPQIDYISFTSFDDCTYETHLKLASILDKMGKRSEGETFLQYIGIKWQTPHGTAFLGQGEQSSKTT